MVNAIPLKQFLRLSYRMLGGQQGPSGRVRKISPTLGFDLRTVQPVAMLSQIYYSNTIMCLVKLFRLEIC
jgi:hypothetical protein